MTQDNGETTDRGAERHMLKPALQVVCLGSSGGPSEENVTGLLVRSLASDWAKGSLLAVDAGSHLAPIVRILERDFPSISELPDISAKRNSNGYGNHVQRESASPTPPELGDELMKPAVTTLANGPFAGLKFPNASARANALHVIRNYVSTYLITHPHLDHLSGFAINTAAFHATSRPKTMAALPSTVEAIKQHVFNDIIWPNLTDEDGGVGFVTFQRLKEGGDVMVGEGEGRGYLEVSDGLSVKPLKVSHGVCTKSPPSHHHRGSISGLSEMQQPPYHEPAQGLGRSASMASNGQYSVQNPQPRQSFYGSQQPSPGMSAADQQSCVVDSTAFFVRDTKTGREVLIFGDVEPDSLSLSPRNHVVWQAAASRIAHGLLGGVFIESSYDDSQADAVLFGHLNPRHLIAELQTLAGLVHSARQSRHRDRAVNKRKRSVANGSDAVAHHALSEHDNKRSRSLASRTGVSRSDERRSSVPDHAMCDAASQPLSQHEEQEHQHDNEPTSPRTIPPANTNTTPPHPQAEMPLGNVKIVIIHVKDTMKDGPHVKDNILSQLREHETRLQEEGQGLGCEFVVAESGESYWF